MGSSFQLDLGVELLVCGVIRCKYQIVRIHKNENLFFLEKIKKGKLAIIQSIFQIQNQDTPVLFENDC